MGTPSTDCLIFSINKTLENLIQRIEPLTHKKGKDLDISPLLEEFYNTVVQSEMYLQNGVLTINFGKAAVFLDYAFSIYSKQVDLLWDMAIDSQRRFLSYEEDSAEKVEAEQRLEEKASKGKRGRKKKQKEPVKVRDLTKFGADLRKCIERLREFDDITFEFDSERALEINGTLRRRLERLRRTKINRKKYPNKYMIKPYVETPFVVELDDECKFNNENSFANRMEFIYPEIERKFQYNYKGKRNVDIIGCDVSDTAFQHYIIEKNINPMDLTAETYKLFEKYLENYMIHGPQQASLVEQQKKLCPRRTSILLTRLPEDVMQKYLKPDETANTETNTADSGVSNVLPNIITDVNMEPNNDNSETALVNTAPNMDDSGFVDGPPGLDTSDIVPVEGNDTVVHSTPVTEKQVEKRKEKCSAKRKTDDDEAETPRRKVRKRSEIIKWLKTTTAQLKKFEQFFCKTYLTEEGEGEIPYQEFSSDEDEMDNGSQNIIPLQTTDLNATTSADSGLGDSLNVTLNTSQITIAETPTQDLTAPNSTPENQREKSDWDLEQEAINEMQLRYYEWSDYIREELTKYTNCDFDIHEYGTTIIDQFSDEKPTIRFDDVLQGDSTSEIARFFAATLQLTNTANVELSNWTEGELATDLQLTLLSKERHHERLGEYKAPSVDVVRENVDKIKGLSVDRDDFLKKIESERLKYPDSRPGSSGLQRVRSYKRTKMG